MRAADADVHDAVDRLAGRAPPVAGSYALCEVEHARQRDLDGLPVRGGPFRQRCPQGSVQSGPLLRRVDLRASEQVFYPAIQTRGVSQRQQRMDDLLVQPLLGEVDE